VFAFLAYGVWYVNSNRDDVVAEFVTSVPERLGQLLSSDDEMDERAKMEGGSIGSEDSAKPLPRLPVAATAASDQPGGAPQTDVASSLGEPASDGVRRLPSEQDAERVIKARPNAAPDAQITEAMPTSTPGPSSGTSPVATTPGQVADEPTRPMVNPVVAAVGPGSEPGVSPEGGGPAGTSFGDPEDSRIVLRAKAESWIQVRDEPNDRVLLARLLRPGDEYRVPNRSGLNLWTGNAGGLEILVDGEPAPSIGETGAVRRRVVLEVEPLRAGAAVR
jgi:cytoskeleton protein RodZ